MESKASSRLKVVEPTWLAYLEAILLSSREIEEKKTKSERGNKKKKKESHVPHGERGTPKRLLDFLELIFKTLHNAAF